MSLVEYDNGIHITGPDLWLDSRDSQDLCIISHGHIDHLGRHSKIIATKPTALIYEQRMGETEVKVLEYGEKVDVNGAKVSMYPAGHILGSAQVLINADGKKILYSGDFKLRDSVTAEPIEIVSADYLVMEATYGSPKNLFPDKMAVLNDLYDAVCSSLQNGEVPIIIAYSLGKGQEVVKYLGDRNINMSVHSTIFRLIKIYEMFNVSFVNYTELVNLENCKGKVLVVPPYSSGAKDFVAIKNKKVFLLSGWKNHDGVKDMTVDHVFQVSDHADFNELLEYVRKVSPKKVFVTHGEPCFIKYLRQEGFDADFIGGAF